MANAIHAAEPDAGLGQFSEPARSPPHGAIDIAAPGDSAYCGQLLVPSPHRAQLLLRLEHNFCCTSGRATAGLFGSPKRRPDKNTSQDIPHRDALTVDHVEHPSTDIASRSINASAIPVSSGVCDTKNSRA